MVLNSFYNVALANSLEEFLGSNHVEVVKRNFEVAEVTRVFLEGRWVSESTLIVRYRPLRSAHHAQVVVGVRVDASHQRVLGGEALACYKVSDPIMYLVRAIFCLDLLV